MRFEDMKNNIPETPDFIHEMIQNEVDRQLQGTTIIQIPKKRKKWNGARVAAAAMVCVLATSTAAYAGVKVPHVCGKTGRLQCEDGDNIRK